MQAQVLRPAIKTLEIKGRLIYKEANRSWSILRFKKELINEFPQLREVTSKFSYRMTLHRESNALEKDIRRIKRNKEALPILMWIEKEKTIKD